MDIVSACLVGCKCRWNGKDKKREDHRFKNCVPVCPELFAGLGIPREAAEIRDGRIISANGDQTEQFQKGFARALEFAKAFNAKKAFLKEKSSSCGVTEIYDGSFTGATIQGEGLFTKLLKENGIEVIGVE